MASTQELLRSRLLQLYLENAGSFGAGLEATVLRSESVQMREVLAYAASNGTMTAQELTTKVLTQKVSAYSLNLKWLARLAYTAALQDVRASDAEFAEKALTLARDELTKSDAPKRFNKLLAELLFEQGRFDELEKLAAERPDIRSHFYNYILVDSRNHAVREHEDQYLYEQWLFGFNRQFVRNDLIPIFLRPGDEVPFNRLETATEAGPQKTGPLVTVIMTSFKPKREDIMQSARSILSQTWNDIELIIVDDASPVEYSSVLDELEALDERVRVIRLKVNGGTYAARNRGISEANGEFITGQDADDWSHPQRVQTQVTHLLRNSHRPGNQVFTVNMTEDLVRVRRGYSPFIPSAPTLMVRASIMRELGGYLPARKAADNELRDRVSAYTGSDVYQIAEPLIFMRILPDSLSRSDFRPGWQHPARRAFWSSYRTWHASQPREQLRLRAHERTPIYVPPRFTQAPESVQGLDFVFVADWCENGETQLAALSEISLLVSHGYRVGVMHLENAVHLSEYSRTYIQKIQNLISAGQVVSVLADEDFHSVRCLVVCDPEILEFIPDGSVAFPVKQVIVLAKSLSWTPPGFHVNYLPSNCARNSLVYFGKRPLWVARTENVHKHLAHILPKDEVAQVIQPAVVDASQFAVRRTGPRGVRPVIGRWAGSRQQEWPIAAETIRQIWPTDGSIDVRLYGDPRAVLRTLAAKRLPAAWLCWQPQDIDRRTFYRSLDFFVQFQATVAGADRELRILEALASGCIVILPQDYEAIYGSAAVYAEPHEVRDVIERFMTNSEEYRDQSRRGPEYVHSFGVQPYINLMNALHPIAVSEQEAVIS